MKVFKDKVELESFTETVLVVASAALISYWVLDVLLAIINRAG